MDESAPEVEVDTTKVEEETTKVKTDVTEIATKMEMSRVVRPRSSSVNRYESKGAT